MKNIFSNKKAIIVLIACSLIYNNYSYYNENNVFLNLNQLLKLRLTLCI